MPLVVVHMIAGRPTAYRHKVADVIYQAMRDTLNVPNEDRFEIINEVEPDDFTFSPTYLGIERTDEGMFIQITLNSGRTLDQKKAFYKAVADGLHQQVHVRKQDVLINLVEVAKENWSFGNGEAQYAG
ncbi:4-oxalocrotonate tautomerase [Candidatus Koribacter versatilis Ellin345]|uniref:4-oxalocrotonate tautomerase n=1 Tax=Koribacter versatilis (strain Ellin345) TaxID=204669 RepID=Q1IHI2_KORVE|nr:tautomerase family protein [Candidatus Koribacter versatilis]ABF43668.1 4-oxalocrotonate tautomerase [Candidatus Koribacter versatilis Ellin345]